MTSRIVRHRHPDYPRGKCGLPVTEVADGGKVKYEYGGSRRVKCPECGHKIKPEDTR